MFPNIIQKIFNVEEDIFSNKKLTSHNQTAKLY